jgi:hypothetical protein
MRSGIATLCRPLWTKVFYVSHSSARAVCPTHPFPVHLISNNIWWIAHIMKFTLVYSCTKYFILLLVVHWILNFVLTRTRNTSFCSYSYTKYFILLLLVHWILHSALTRTLNTSFCSYSYTEYFILLLLLHWILHSALTRAPNRLLHYVLTFSSWLQVEHIY